MKNEKRDRLLIAGTMSGSGKTTVTCAILRAFQRRGKKLAACKCGPDYIDPMFHETVLDVPSENLDLFFHSPDVQTRLFLRHTEGMDLTIAEGVMGYYDGSSFEDTKGSSFEIAKTLRMPVLLVLNCRGMGHSILPYVKGFLDYKKPSYIRAILLNGITERTYERIRPVLETYFSTQNLDVRLAGYFPQVSDAVVKSRHLGLYLPSEVQDLKKKMDLLADQAEQTIDLALLEKIASEAPDFAGGKERGRREKKEVVRIAAARDEAFCFYYKDNLEFLRERGCEIIPFSPLHDTALPKDTNGVILAGGYPELYAKELARNRSMRDSLFYGLESGIPCLAECGGFLYLKEELEGIDKTVYPMVGFLKGRGYRKEKMGRFGYLTLEVLEENPFLKKGQKLRGHEFHYWDCTENGEVCLAVKPDGKRSWKCVEVKERVFAGFPHISFYSEPMFAETFLNLCREVKTNEKRRKTATITGTD